MMFKSLKVSHAYSSKENFVKTYGSIYEHSEWIAIIAWQQRLNNKDDDALVLLEMMSKIVDDSTYEQKLKLLQLHPELANKTALAPNLTDESQSEQSGAGLTDCTTEEYARFAKYNTDYNLKFGFPFIIAVTGLNKHDILSHFELRLKNNVGDEFTEALIQVHKIAQHRMEEHIYYD